MNKKLQYELLLLVLVTIVIFNLAIVFTSQEESATNYYNITEVGHNVNGTVYKIVAGNASSNDTVGVILGVHPREHEIHDAINKTVYNITHSNDRNLTKKYVIYYVKVKDNLTTREDTRPAGELLANKFIVNNIAKDKPFIVVDVHEINPDYEYYNFIFPLSNKTDKVNSYLATLSKEVNLVNFEFNEGTSPEKVTKPIAKKGIPTFLMETSITDSATQKQHTAINLINSLDGLKPL